MSDTVTVPNQATVPKTLSRKHGRICCSNCARRDDYLRLKTNPRIVGLPIKMLQGTFGPNYVAHAKAGAITVVVFKDDYGEFFYKRTNRVQEVVGRRAFDIISDFGGVPKCGRAGAVKFLQYYCEESLIRYNKIVYGLVG